MNTFSTPTLGTLYTLGYAAPGSSAVLEEVMTVSEVVLVDIRLRPRSRWWPVWNKKQLRERWGSRYTHEKQLGNVNYQDRLLPVQLMGPNVEQAIAGLEALLVQGYSVVLLCACKEYETCHRKFVAEMILQKMQPICSLCLKPVERADGVFCSACRVFVEGDENATIC